MSNLVGQQQIKIIRTIIAVTATVVTILGVGIAVGVYRSQINNNTNAVKDLCTQGEITKAKAYQNEKDIIKIQSAVERTDERTGDIKKSLERIEERLKGS